MKEEIKSPSRFKKKENLIEDSDSVSNSVSDSWDDKRNIKKMNFIESLRKLLDPSNKDIKVHIPKHLLGSACNELLEVRFSPIQNKNDFEQLNQSEDAPAVWAANDFSK